MDDSTTRDESLVPLQEGAMTEESAAPVASPGDVAELSPLAQAEEDTARARQEAGEWREAYLRKLAEFDNYRKRQEREMAEFRRDANAALLRELLPVVDNLERAVAASGDEENGILLGVALVLRQLKEVLGRTGVAELDPTGQVFDPTLHEAVSRLETAATEPDSVVQVLQKGYRHGERLLRPALVVVAAPIRDAVPAPAGEDGQGEP